MSKLDRMVMSGRKEFGEGDLLLPATEDVSRSSIESLRAERSLILPTDGVDRRWVCRR